MQVQAAEVSTASITRFDSQSHHWIRQADELSVQDAWNSKDPEKVSKAYTPGVTFFDALGADSSEGSGLHNCSRLS